MWKHVGKEEVSIILLDQKSDPRKLIKYIHYFLATTSVVKKRVQSLDFLVELVTTNISKNDATIL